MKKSGCNVWLLLLALLLILAMVLTLLYGHRGTSRHGYGRELSTPPYQGMAVITHPDRSPVASGNSEFVSRDRSAPQVLKG
ncbi:MAG TPA: hypothetical protein VJ910_12245 [Desulfuromonadales bacterium]|nr:hypothetical protein [Desulfuromonadales bacterium]